MTPLQREALQMCLEYIETDAHERRHVRWKINEALAQQEIVDIAALVDGMEVSIDVSTGDHDSGNRLFGSVTLVQENQGSKHGLILLVQDPEANFKTAAPKPPARKPLTDEEIETVWRSVQANDFHDCVKPFARAIEAAHGITATREHVTDDSQCWCNPEITYTDPDTGVSVIVHKEPQ